MPVCYVFFFSAGLGVAETHVRRAVWGAERAWSRSQKTREIQLSALSRNTVLNEAISTIQLGWQVIFWPFSDYALYREHNRSWPIDMLSYMSTRVHIAEHNRHSSSRTSHESPPSDMRKGRNANQEHTLYRDPINILAFCRGSLYGVSQFWVQYRILALSIAQYRSKC